MKNFLRLFTHDIKLQIRNHLEWASLILFFTIIILLLPFVIGPDQELLRRLAPGLIWMAVLLMSFLSLERLFIQDARDGTLDLMLLSPLPLPAIVLSKLLAQTVMMLTALLIMIIPACILLNMDITIIPVLALTLILGVPSIVLLGGIIGAITVALHRSPALLTILLVPFYIPILIFATGACENAATGIPPQSNLLLLSAILTLMLPSTPFIIAATLRQE